MDAEPALEKQDKVRWELRDGVATITVVNPPVNALVQPVREGILRGIERAEASGDVAAILIRAEGQTFPAGADVREFSSQSARPTLGELCDRIEACRKPVLAAIHGTALGGGFELALACHYRMCLPDARFGFPEVTLGLVPNAGGTQRLPRIVGARLALDLLAGGKPIDAQQAKAAGLIDKVVQKNLPRASFGSARNFGEMGTEPRPTRHRNEGLADPARYLDVVAARRRGIETDAPEVVSRIIDLVEAALLVPFDAGLDMEHVAYEDLVNSGTARGLRHAFLAERRAGRYRELASAKPMSISAVGVVGAGPLARDVAMAALATGVPVTLALEGDSAISRARGRIEASYARAVETGRIPAKTRDARLARLVVSEDYRSLADADIIIEALPEDADRKADVLGRIGPIAMRHAIVASSTAECDIEVLADATGRPERFAALHFIPPADRNRLVEVAPSRRTDREVAATLFHVARAMGKQSVLAQPHPGLIFNQLRWAYYSAAALVVEQGAQPSEVDAAMTAYGLPVGPFQAQDISGLDVVWGLQAEDCPSNIPLRMIDNAWYGQRSGQGYYRYDETENRAHSAPDVLAMIDELRADLDIAPQRLSAEDIQTRCLYAMANEGARLVASGVARRPSDVDAAMLLAIGFPREKGGPMLVADLAGSVAVRKALKSWAGEDDFWQPVPLWDELIKSGRSFEDLDRA